MVANCQTRERHSERASKCTRKHLGVSYGYYGMFHALLPLLSLLRLSMLHSTFSTFHFRSRTLFANILLLKIFIYMCVARAVGCTTSRNGVLKWNDLFRGAIPIDSRIRCTRIEYIVCTFACYALLKSDFLYCCCQHRSANGFARIIYWCCCCCWWWRCCRCCCCCLLL